MGMGRISRLLGSLLSRRNAVIPIRGSDGSGCTLNRLYDWYHCTMDRALHSGMSPPSPDLRAVLQVEMTSSSHPSPLAAATLKPPPALQVPSIRPREVHA